jgi:hypothetical protein
MLCLPHVICPRSWCIYRCQPHHADSCQKDSFCTFHGIVSADWDMSICSSRYLQVAHQLAGYQSTWSWECYTVRPAQLAVQHDAVSAQCCARSAFHLRRFWSSHPALINLHWLRVPGRVEFKVAMLAYCCLHGLAPQYLTAALHRTVEVNSRCRLRSADRELLLILQSRLITMGDHSFLVAEPWS